MYVLPDQEIFSAVVRQAKQHPTTNQVQAHNFILNAYKLLFDDLEEQANLLLVDFCLDI
jgi:hypothetical protein